MSKAIYRETLPISRKAAEAKFVIGDHREIATSLVQLALHDPDWRWVLEKCLYFLEDEDVELKAVAVTCLGHLARIHRKPELSSLVPLLESIKGDDRLAGVAEDALEDILYFSSGSSEL